MGHFKVFFWKFFLLLWVPILWTDVIRAQVEENTGTRHFLEQTITAEPHSIEGYAIEVDDSAHRDTLYQVRSQAGFPIRYYRKIIQEVCFEGDCRLLHVNLYWNITGRYLGIELPKGEFLSKAEHEPFILPEYQRLGVLLADSLSPLAHYHYDELVPEDRASKMGLDAITSATAPYALDYVVSGAVYTTYTLWHLVYGNTRQEVMRLTEYELSAELMFGILSSPDRGDQFWVLKHIGDKVVDGRIRDRIIDLINGQDYNLALAAIGAIDPHYLDNDSLQVALSRTLSETGYSLKGSIIKKLAEAPQLNRDVLVELGRTLHISSGDQLIRIFDLFKQHKVKDIPVLKEIAKLLASENKFVSEKAYEYLQTINVGDPIIKKHLEDYVNKI